MLRLSRTVRALLVAIAVGAAAGGCKDACRDSPECKLSGHCTSRGATCLAMDDRDCAAARVCRAEGQCHAAGMCIARSEDSCRASQACTEDGRCVLQNARCCTPDGRCEPQSVIDARARARRRGHAGGGDNKEGGCPCGCDHSAPMAAELRLEAPEVAARRIARSLAVIAEREGAGYVTEAMVQHRLRLLGVARDLGLSLEPRPVSTPLAQDHTPAVGVAPGVRAQADLVVNGEHTEWVGGRQKALHAAFRVHLRLENTTRGALAFALPTLLGTPPLQVERWYVLGTAGEPWDGLLPGGAELSLLGIGTLPDGALPGDAVSARLEFEGLALDLRTIARARWDRPPTADPALAQRPAEPGLSLLRP